MRYLLYTFSIQNLKQRRILLLIDRTKNSLLNLNNKKDKISIRNLEIINYYLYRLFDYIRYCKTNNIVFVCYR